MGSQTNKTFNFYLSNDVNLPVRVHIGAVIGAAIRPDTLGLADKDAEERGGAKIERPAAAHVTARLWADGEELGLDSRTMYAEAGTAGCVWDETLEFCHKFRDLPANAMLALTVYAWREGGEQEVVGGSTMRLFSKRGRLKTGMQRLRLWADREADVRNPKTLKTPGKVPVAERGSLGQLEALLKRCARGELAAVDWLDRLTLKEVARMRAAHEAHDEARRALTGELEPAHIYIELPSFAHAVFYQPPGPSVVNQAINLASASHAEEGSINSLHDPEVDRKNPAEIKAQRMRRMLTRDMKDESLMPDTDQRERIERILRLPPGKGLDEEQQELVWHFRYYLCKTEAGALVKFLKSVNWTDSREISIAESLMKAWAKISVADALQLLSPDFEAAKLGSHAIVRAHAVTVLEDATDTDMLYYLLQLVQALRYESTDDSPLAGFLVRRSAERPELAVQLHWYLYVELNDRDEAFARRAAAVHGMLMDAIRVQPEGRSSGSAFDTISRQDMLRAQLDCLAGLITGRGASARTAALRSALEGEMNDLATARLPSPTGRGVVLDGLVPGECRVFGSAMAPLLLAWKVAGDAEETARHYMIYKRGDDLRQDQFVLQMFGLMGNILCAEGLDLCGTQYAVLPTTTHDGLVEFVEGAKGINDVTRSHKGDRGDPLRAFLRRQAADPSTHHGIKAEVMNRFARSCALYCVMTFILGIGDRHLDNIMLQPDGRLFHIDFGYILGDGPRQYQITPMRIATEFVQCMGGQESGEFDAFRKYACEAYNIIRKNANLILSLLHLMAGASLSAISSDPEAALLKVQDKLRLDLSDEDARQYLQVLIKESANAMMPQVTEAMHRVANRIRA